MIDLRYHIYSLAAVFLALAVGVVVGNSFTATSPVAEQSGKLTRMERMVRKLEKDFALVRAEMVQQQSHIHDLQAAAERDESFLRAVLPTILKNRLAWRNVAIIQTGSYDISGQLKTALELSGAQVTSVTRILPQRIPDEPEAVAALAAALELQPATDEHVASPIYRTLAQGLVSARNPEKLVQMEKLKVIVRSGDYTRWNKLIVIVGGAAKEDQDHTEQIDVLLIDEFRKAGATVVGCEPADTVESCIKAYRKAGVATVDNADRAAGQVALVCALAGETGHFGVKSTADRFLPASIEGRSR